MYVCVCVYMRVRAPLHDYVSIHISTSESHDFIFTKLRMSVMSFASTFTLCLLISYNHSVKQKHRRRDNSVTWFGVL